MLAVNGSDQRARTKALPKRRTCEIRNNTTYIHNNQYNTQAKTMMHTIDKQ